jgi:hypothetical protein
MPCPSPDQLRLAENLRNTLSTVFESELVPEHFQGEYNVEIGRTCLRQLQADGRLQLGDLTVNQPLLSRNPMTISIGPTRFARNLSINEVRLPLRTGSNSKKHWLVLHRQEAGNIVAQHQNQYKEGFGLTPPDGVEIDDKFLGMVLDGAGIETPVLPSKPRRLRGALARLANQSDTFSTRETIPIPIDNQRVLTVEREIDREKVEIPQNGGRPLGEKLRQPKEIMQTHTRLSGKLERFILGRRDPVSVQTVEYNGINAVFGLPDFSASFGLGGTQASSEILEAVDTALRDYLFQTPHESHSEG